MLILPMQQLASALLTLTYIVYLYVTASLAGITFNMPVFSGVFLFFYYYSYPETKQNPAAQNKRLNPSASLIGLVINCSYFYSSATLRSSLQNYTILLKYSKLTFPSLPTYTNYSSSLDDIFIIFLLIQELSLSQTLSSRPLWNALNSISDSSNNTNNFLSSMQVNLQWKFITSFISASLVPSIKILPETRSSSTFKIGSTLCSTKKPPLDSKRAALRQMPQCSESHQERAGMN